MGSASLPRWAVTPEMLVERLPSIWSVVPLLDAKGYSKPSRAKPKPGKVIMSGGPRAGDERAVKPTLYSLDMFRGSIPDIEAYAWLHAVGKSPHGYLGMGRYVDGPATQVITVVLDEWQNITEDFVIPTTMEWQFTEQTVARRDIDDSHKPAKKLSVVKDLAEEPLDAEGDPE